MPNLPDELTLRGDGVVLRDFTDDDLEAVARLFDDPEVRRWYPIPAPDFEAEPIAAARAFVQRGRTRRVEGKLLRLAITTDGSEVKGEIAFIPEAGLLGYVVASECRRTGLASRAIRLLLAYARDELGTTTAHAVIEPENVASCRLVESLGFRVTKTETADDNGQATTLQTWTLQLKS
jgi:RimJ/RimL family protein N-acetyltransferase